MNNIYVQTFLFKKSAHISLCLSVCPPKCQSRIFIHPSSVRTDCWAACLRRHTYTHMYVQRVIGDKVNNSFELTLKIVSFIRLSTHLNTTSQQQKQPESGR